MKEQSTQRYSRPISIVKGAVFIVILLWGSAGARADEIPWSPVTASDWNIVADSTRGYKDAVMLFEHAYEDDEYLAGRRCVFTMYRRVRVLTAAGRSEADVQFIFDDEDQEVKSIRARAILRDGRIVDLRDEQVHTTLALNTEKLNYKQAAFSIPGVTEDCIIEYQFVLWSKGPNSKWIPQKKIPVIHAEYSWRYFRPKPLVHYDTDILRKYLIPNFQWINAHNLGYFELLPSKEDPDTARFWIDNLPAITHEPYMPAEASLETQMMLYYGDAEGPDIYWQTKATEERLWLKRFSASDSRLDDSIAAWSALGTSEAKIARVYQWIQSEFVDPYTDRSSVAASTIEVNATADEMLKRKYGSIAEQHALFWLALQRLGIQTSYCHTTNRGDREFIKTAKYWQFSGSAIGIADSSHHYRFYAPGYKYLPPGYLPNTVEGTVCMELAPNEFRFMVLPYSRPDSNRIARVYTLALSEEGLNQGQLQETAFGQEARTLRKDLQHKSDNEQATYIKDRVSSLVEHAITDSVRVDGATLTLGPLRITSHVEFPTQLQRAGSRLIVQPQSGLATYDNPFTSSERIYPILFTSAFELTEEFRLRFPEGYIVEGSPTDTSVSNAIGLCMRECSFNDSVITILKTVRLYNPSMEKTKYPDVQQFFSTIEAFDRTPFVLKKKGIPEPPKISPTAPKEKPKVVKKATGKKKK